MLNPDPYGSDSDLGLVPGGRVKLVKSATVNLASGPAHDLLNLTEAFSSLRVHCLQFHPLHTNHIYVGTDIVSAFSQYSTPFCPFHMGLACWHNYLEAHLVA